MSSYQVTERIEEGKEQHGYGVFDKKGREVGAVIRYEVQVREPASWGFTSDLTSGTVFYVNIKQTRSEKPFGSADVIYACRTEEERIAKVEKYLSSAKKRAIKSFAQ